MEPEERSYTARRGSDRTNAGAHLLGSQRDSLGAAGAGCHGEHGGGSKIVNGSYARPIKVSEDQKRGS